MLCLFEEKIVKIKELNAQLLKEKDTINKKVLLIKIDTNGIIKELSEAMLNLLEYEKEEIVDVEFFQFERFNIDHELAKEIQQAMSEQKVFKFENKALTNSGETLWFGNTIVPQYDIYGEHLGFIIFKDNLTDAKELHQHQEKLLINSRSAAMGEMISMIAHQWRQPLSVINTIISTLRIQKELDILEDKEVDESYTKIEETIQYLSNTIDDFRNFFKKRKILSKISLYEIFEKSTILLKTDMELKEIKYTQNIDKELMISTYQNELIQALISIFKNALDALNEVKIVDKEIMVNVQSYATHLTITIKDNGGGIKNEIIQKVFEPYFSTKSKNGTGLGLYMCKAIIEKNLKGKLSISSQDNFTEVLIELPHSIK